MSRSQLGRFVLFAFLSAKATTAPAFVQQNYATPQSNVSSVSVSHTSAQIAGNTNIVAVGPNDCSVTGGTSSSPTSLSTVLSNTQCMRFNLDDGYYSAVTITRPNIVVKAVNKCGAILKPEVSIQALNVTVDGISVTTAGVGISVSKAGAKVLNSCVQGFGKSQYGVGIWVFQQALDPNNKVIIEGNQLSDWGGAQYSAGIAVGKAADDPNFPTAISVEIRKNRITGGTLLSNDTWESAIQSFHPFLAYGNYINSNNGPAIQNKAFNSRVACNEVVNGRYDGALYNRLNSNNVWEYNVVHDSEVGIDHFMGDGNIFRGNVFYNVDYFGRVKDQGIGSINLTFENNTFYSSRGRASFIWDDTSGSPLINILWQKNIWHTTNGSAINSSSSLDPAWDETSNIFFRTIRPTGTTGASGTSLAIDPKFVNAPLDFRVQEPSATGKGAPWPLPCP